MKLKSSRIKANDFLPEDKQLIENLGRTLNPLIDKIELGFNKNLTVEDNLPFEFKNLDIEVDLSGVPIGNSSIRTNLVNLKGYVCVNVLDINNTGILPSSAVSLFVETAGNTVNIRKITGLPTGAVYRLVLMGIS